MEGSLPSNAKSIDIVSAVSGPDEEVVSEILGVVCDQAWKIVLMDLFDERMLWGNEHVFQQAGLSRRDVREPATHLEQRSQALNV